MPPKPRTDGQQLRDMLVSEGIPVFNAEIPRLAAFEKAAAAPLGWEHITFNGDYVWPTEPLVGKLVGL